MPLIPYLVFLIVIGLYIFVVAKGIESGTGLTSALLGIWLLTTWAKELKVWARGWLDKIKN